MFGSGWGQNNQNQQNQQPQQGQQQSTGLFGQPAQPQTGGFGSTGFGSTGFGQPQQPQQQQTSIFGQPQQPQQQSGFGGFGTGATNTGGAFGSTGFGTNTNTTTTPSFSFGSNTTQPTNAFGGTSTGFGTNTTQTSTFGQPAPTNTFGASTSGGFGTGTNTSTTFGSGTGTFGSTNTTGTTGGIFGAAKPATGLFGSTTTTTATPAATGQGQGTASPAYVVTQERDTAVGGGSTTLHYQSITAMPAYRNFSFEELRAQDYLAGRKNSTSSGFGQTSAFGAPTTTAPATNIFGQTQQNQPQQQQTSIFGQPAQPAQTGGLFGQNTNQSQQPATNVFGQPATNTGTGLFGQPQQPQQPQQTTGLFGQPAAPAANTTGTGLFGQPAQPAQTNAFGTNTGTSTFGSGGLFAPKPATTGFGSTPTTTGFGATGSAFGQPQNQPGQTTSIFGQPQNQQQNQTQPTTTFGFGANNTTNKPLFGQPAQPTTGLFGQPAQPAQQTTSIFGQAQPNTTTQPAATGGIFGGGFGQQQQNQAQPAQPSTGLFGQPAQPQPASTGTGLFGGGIFGANNNQQQQPQPGNSVFGKPPGTTSGLFGSTTAAPATNTFGFGANNATQQPSTGTSLFGQANKSIFGNSPAAAQPTQQSSIFGNPLQNSQAPGGAQPTMTASIDQNPFGNNPLFANLPPGPHVFSVSQDQTKKPLIHVSPRKSFYRPTTPQLTKLRGFGTSQAGPDVSTINPFNRSASAPGSKALLTSQSLTASISDGKSLGSSTIGGRSSVKKLVLDKDITASDLPTLGSPGSLFNSPARNTQKSKVVFHPDLIQRAVDGERNSGLFGSTSSRALPPTRPSIDMGHSYSANAPVRDESVVPEDTPDPQEGEYWMKPSLKELQAMSHDQLVSVPNFTVGRYGYGQIKFLSPVDLTTVYAISGIPEKTVLFEEGACTVYPDESQKAPRGEGLNVPAEISLEKCWPRDKATRAPIKNRNDPAWQRQERKLSKMKDTEFVGLEPENGTWTFRVPHFTRYGLGDDDDEDEDAESQPGEPAEEGSASHTESEEEEDEGEVEQGMLGARRSPSEEESVSSSPSASPVSDRRVALKSATPDGSPDKPKPRQPTRPWAATIELDPRKVQVMQASMFHNADETLQPDELGPVPRQNQHAKTLTRSGFPASRNALPEAPKPIVEDLPLRKFERVENDKSVTKSFAGAYMDAGLALGRSFRVGWGPDGQLVHLGKICGASAKDELPSSPTLINITQVPLLSNPTDVERPRANKLLDFQIKNTDVEVDEDGVPTATPNSDIRFHHVADLFGPDDRSHESSVWRLGSALFDEINLRLAEDVSPDIRKHVDAMRRRAALAKWLQLAVAPSVEFDLRELNGSTSANRAFLMLTGNQVARATEVAMESNEMHLATLVSQIGGDEEFRRDIESQLAKWKDQKIDAHIDVWIRKIYALLAGIVDHIQGSKEGGDIVIAQGLDWKRAYGLHLWFGGSFSSPVVDSLNSYETACDHSLLSTAAPHPWYIERPSSIDSSALTWTVAGENAPKDALFEVVKLAMDEAIPLDAVLYPRAFGPSPVDYRISWHIYMLLAHVLRKRDVSDRSITVDGESDEVYATYSHKADVMTSNYASQLENLGLWWYSAFVLLHLQEPEGRSIAIKSLLARHIEELDSEREEFLLNQLCVPAEWIAEAKAVLLQYSNQSYRAFECFVAAGQVKPAYDMAMRDLAPEAAIRNDFDLLTALFTDKGFDGLDDWTFRGKLYLQYAECMSKLPDLLLDVALGEEDPIQARELERLSRAVPQLLGLLPEMFPDKSNIRQQICLGNMISSLMQFLPALKHRGMVVRPQLQSAMVEESVRLEHIQAMAHDRFMTAIESYA
ncbi:nucleoporin [Ceratobasidium sp. AG-Ba]|nr:nucleoporin [Ceratobasidium sp. AG-Ba]